MATMAIGFELSKVLNLSLQLDRNSISFDLRTVRYEIIFDDIRKIEEVVAFLEEIKKKASITHDKKKHMPDFYIDKKSNGEM
jgi:hypothetical protein